MANIRFNKVWLTISAVAIVLTLSTSCEQLNDFLDDAEIEAGLKEALNVSTDTSVASASALDGYFGNALIKIAFPEEAQIVVDVLSIVPGGQILIDEVVLKLNRAAEEAAIKATPIFRDAVFNLTFADAVGILNGIDTAATHYLRTNTSDGLYSAFEPDINDALSAVGAQQAWDEMMSLYNSIPFVNPVNEDLADYTSHKAIDGLFYLVGEEERKIRLDPFHRVTDLLQSVFGS